MLECVGPVLRLDRGWSLKKGFPALGRSIQSPPRDLPRKVSQSAWYFQTPHRARAIRNRQPMVNDLTIEKLGIEVAFDAQTRLFLDQIET